ncbi:hypothetical protein QBC47DRAFT_410793 [Echria macrotheca]|uniref:Uncharacterized protein n=1 Tax=Echria macrotheca TaxID=438768 RepID=A0AAJ0F8J8_9PEZI|nr:hypothetical protein QBC47DRAFT_410793 [Echria macrotheca]
MGAGEDWAAKAAAMRAAIKKDVDDKDVRAMLFPPDHRPAASDKVLTRAEAPMEDALSVIDAAVTVGSKLLMALGPAGMAAGAGIGFIYALLRPGSDDKKDSQLSVHSQMLALAQDFKASINDLAMREQVRTATNTLVDFQTWLGSQKLVFKMTKGDFKAIEKDVLDPLHNWVTGNGSGTLTHALSDLRPSIKMENYNNKIFHSLVGLAVESIIQAYALRIRSYVIMATQKRMAGDIEGYNTDLATILIALDEVKAKVPGYIDDVEKDYNALQEERIGKVFLEGSAPKDGYSGYRGQFLLLPGRKSESDEEWNKWKANALKSHMESYKAQIRGHLKNFPEQIRPFLCDKRNELDKLLSEAKGPVDPIVGPAVSRPLIKIAEDNKVPEGVEVSYRFKLVDGEGKSLANPSPWSVWVTQGAPHTSAEFLIGDGWALVDTARQIWRRMRKGSDETQEEFVEKISGHGILTWPTEKKVAIAR